MDRDNDAGSDVLSFVQVGVPAARAVDRAFELELEIAMLGACVADPAVIDQVGGIVEPDDFLEPINARLFEVMLSRRFEGGKIDAALITDEVTRALLDDEGADFVERYVGNILRARVKPKFPKAFAVKLRARSKERTEA